MLNHTNQHIFKTQVMDCFKVLSHLKFMLVITFHEHKVCEMAKSSLNTISILVYASKAVKNVAGKVQDCNLCSTCLD